jgi:hypothetical protein
MRSAAGVTGLEIKRRSGASCTVNLGLRESRAARGGSVAGGGILRRDPGKPRAGELRRAGAEEWYVIPGG